MQLALNTGFCLSLTRLLLLEKEDLEDVLITCGQVITDSSKKGNLIKNQDTIKNLNQNNSEQEKKNDINNIL